MGLRFRKSFKLAPGIRMNVGTGGTSWSLGPRGAAIGIGKRGTYLNAGLPGTGFSYRTRLDAPSSTSGSASTSAPEMVSTQITVEVTDEGHVYFRDQHGNPVSAAIEHQAKVQQPEKIRELVANKCRTINEQFEALKNVHVYTPIPNVTPKFIRLPYDEFEPAQPVVQEYGLMAKVAKRFAVRIDEENAQRQSDFEAALSAYMQKKQAHDDLQTRLREEFFSAIAGIPEMMVRVLENELAQIVWPRETLISLEISPNGDQVFIDVDLPEIEHMPHALAYVTNSGFELSMKRISDTDQRKLYTQHVHSIGFRILGEVFAVLPSVEETIVSGYSQRVDPATGRIDDEYLFSVKAARDQWSAINFNRLEAVDVVEAFSAFDIRRSMTKSGVFKAIEPFENAR